MESRSSVLAILAALIVAGCASGPPFIDSMQPEALSMARPEAAESWPLRLAAGHRHEAQYLVRSFTEFVTFGFEVDGAEDGGLEFGVAAPIA